MPLNDANTTLKRINTQEQADHGTRQQRFTGAMVPTPNREQTQMRRPLGNISQGQAQETPRPTTSREELGQSLRVPVPNATASLRTGASSIPMKHQISQSTNSSDDREPRKTIFQNQRHAQTERQPQTMAQVQKHVQTNVQKQNDTDAPDNATTLSFSEHGYSTEEDRNDEQTMFRRVPDDDMPAYNVNDLNFRRAAVAQYGGRVGSGAGVMQNNVEDDLGSTFEDESDEDVKEIFADRLQKNTPSRAATVPLRTASRPSEVPVTAQKKARFAQPAPPTQQPSKSPILLPPQHQEQSRQAHPGPLTSLARHNDYRQSMPEPEPVQQAGNPFNNVAKVYGAQEGSEDERMADHEGHQRSQPLKRAHDEIDYDVNQLEKMKFSELEAIPFLTNPRATTPQPAVDHNGAPMPLTTRLTNLTKVQPADQASLFHSLDDDENEQVGQWFVQKFQDELKKLMDIRIERRKLALKYEMEVKKRETTVKAKAADVEEELADLRTGGGKLIKGRSVQSVGGTPKGKA